MFHYDVMLQVFLIQACQPSRHAPPQPEKPKSWEHDASAACGCENTHIILNRPHTVLLMASMRDGYARRGAYTDAIAQQFRDADATADISEIHYKAVVKMRQQHGDEQTPEMRSTLYWN